MSSWANLPWFRRKIPSRKWRPAAQHVCSIPEMATSSCNLSRNEHETIDVWPGYPHDVCLYQIFGCYKTPWFPGSLSQVLHVWNVSQQEPSNGQMTQMKVNIPSMGLFIDEVTNIIYIYICMYIHINI